MSDVLWTDQGKAVARDLVLQYLLVVTGNEDGRVSLWQQDLGEVSVQLADGRFSNWIPRKDLWPLCWQPPTGLNA